MQFEGSRAKAQPTPNPGMHTRKDPDEIASHFYSGNKEKGILGMEGRVLHASPSRFRASKFQGTVQERGLAQGGSGQQGAQTPSQVTFASF